MPITANAPDAVDFYFLDELLSGEEIVTRDRLRDFRAREVAPHASRWSEAAESPFELIPKIAELNLAGGMIEGYGCPGLSSVAVGLIAREWARADGSVGTFFGVHSFLAMQTIGLLGAEEQKQRWLPEMARFEKVGAFALTEPDHGSDSIGLGTSARRDGDHYVLDGRKKWIGNASFADLVIVWARGEDGEVGGYVVEKGTPGFRAEVITGKTALRSSWQAKIELTGVRCPPGTDSPSDSFKDVNKVLSSTRYTVAWRAVGLAMASYELARDYALERDQFRKPIATFSSCRTSSRGCSPMSRRCSCCAGGRARSPAEGRLTDGMASLAKLHCSSRARSVVADARDIFGGNGVLLEHGVARHFADMEAIFTFEGTDSIQALIVGREITNIQAISAGGKPV